jgi:TIR domain
MLTESKESISTTLTNSGRPNPREVFVSYRRLDDEPPPDCSSGDGGGFVRYLLRQVRYDLRQMGVPDAVLWEDRAKIAPGDIWSDAIRKALNEAELFVAILSRNYVKSDWCATELSAMASRIAMLDAEDGQRRIFRVDKHNVPEDEIPETLRCIQAVRFYREDQETKRVDEYFWRGKVRRPDDYEKAVNDLARAICARLDELGIPLTPQPERAPSPSGHTAYQSNGRVVFVAKPASDMEEAYRTLVRELRGTGYRVTPDPDKRLDELGGDVRSAVVDGLAEAEASIHLLGKRTGGRPEGLDTDLVPMQLAAAADEARKGEAGTKSGFERMIWAPSVLLLGGSGHVEAIRRDPLGVVDEFGGRLPTDQIEGDPAPSRFNEFVLQRLERRGGGGPSYDPEAMAQALAQVTGRNADEFLAKMDWRVDPKTGKRVEQDAAGEWPKGSKPYPSFACENEDVAKAYDAIKGHGVSVDLL